MPTELVAYRHNWPRTRPLPTRLSIQDPNDPDYVPPLDDFVAATHRLWSLDYDWADGRASQVSYYTTPAGADRRFGVAQGDGEPLTFANWTSFLAWLTGAESYRDYCERVAGGWGEEEDR